MHGTNLPRILVSIVAFACFLVRCPIKPCAETKDLFGHQQHQYRMDLVGEFENLDVWNHKQLPNASAHTFFFCPSDDPDIHIHDRFLLPLRFLDVMRVTSTDLEDAAGNRIEDFWTQPTERQVSHKWCGTRGELWCRSLVWRRKQLRATSAGVARCAGRNASLL